MEESVGKLAAMVAPFRQKLVRYHEILAPNHPDRESVVSRMRTRKKRRPGERMPWADLLKRVRGTEALRPRVVNAIATGLLFVTAY